MPAAAWPGALHAEGKARATIIGYGQNSRAALESLGLARHGAADLDTLTRMTRGQA